MGHQRLKRLPKIRRWDQVFELLVDGAALPELALATYKAAQHGFEQIPKDEGFTRSLTAIFQFIEAFQSKNAVSALAERGFDIKQGESVLDYVIGFRNKAESDVAAVRSRSDIAEIARNSFSDVLMSQSATNLPSLFDTTASDIRQSLQTDLRGSRVGNVMHEFFVNFTKQYLNYHLSRELSNHIGAGKPFASVDSHSEFSRAFELHIRQTVRIADEFTPGWFGKAHFEGRVSHPEVSKFAHVAFKKIRSEFCRGAVRYA